MNHLEISLLGPFRVTRNGAPVTQFRADTARALLAYLALNAGTPHRRETLAGLLWPDQPESEARHNLRQALSRLRTAIGDQEANPPALLVTRKTIQFNLEDDCWLDVAAFDRLVVTCRKHGHPQIEACPPCMQRLGQAADLYRGELMAGFSLPSALFEAWLIVERERLHQQALDALRHLAAYHDRRGEYEQVQRHARRQLALEPWREVAHRQLMRALALSGQRGAALRQYEDCVRVLQEELGVHPQKETVELHQAIAEEQERTVTASRPQRYRLERMISDKGSFGDVWLATDTTLDRYVAVKRPKGTYGLECRELCLSEARMLARLNHPNITTIHDVPFDESERRLYLVMEYVEGKDLEEFITKGPLPLDLALDVAVGVLRALRYAHDRGVVHRDVKPSNIMITDTDPGVKLLDFGLADLKHILQQETHYLVGTPAYMAPEQIEGRSIDGRADLYGLGVVLYQMIVGCLPFDCADEVEMLGAHLHTAPIPLRTLAPTVPPPIERIVLRLLAKDPEDRYSSAKAAIDALGAIHVASRLSNLPVWLTPFVGREAELVAIAERLGAADCRLLTVIGPGGIGKTRLAVEAAAAQRGHFTHGVFFCSLAALQSVDAIVPSVAQAINFSFDLDTRVDAASESQQQRSQLLDYLRQKSMLLILDNFEHLLDSADLVIDILKTAPDIKIVATSRERLNVQGEHLFSVAGIEFPADYLFYAETAQDVARYSAVKLFLTSAHQVRPGFEPTDEDLMAMGQICRLVQGMPLAIQLAAPWVQMLTPAEIAAEIGRDLDVLETDLRDVPERQRSIRTVFDHSWNLLTERERVVFQALSVFCGGFTRQAAQAVTGATLRDLMALVNKSLLHRTPVGQYEVAHELLRQYAVEKLETSGQADAARAAHSAYYAEFLHQRETDLSVHKQSKTLDEIDANLENVLAAWAWALQRKDYPTIRRAMEGLRLFCDNWGRRPGFR
jgi:predicted ATPase